MAEKKRRRGDDAREKEEEERTKKKKSVKVSPLGCSFQHYANIAPKFLRECTATTFSNIESQFCGRQLFLVKTGKLNEYTRALGDFYKPQFFGLDVRYTETLFDWLKPDDLVLMTADESENFTAIGIVLTGPLGFIHASGPLGFIHASPKTLLQLKKDEQLVLEANKMEQEAKKTKSTVPAKSKLSATAKEFIPSSTN